MCSTIARSTSGLRVRGVTLLEVWRQDEVVVLQLAHGKVNALDLELAEALTGALADAGEQPVALTADGRAFSAGVDLRRIVDGGADYVHAFLPALSDALLAVFAHPGPVVAGVNGHALAGGCILAAACDLRVATSAEAQLGVTELAVGVPFPTAAMEVLRHALGNTVTEQLVTSTARLSPRQARDIGLVHELVDDPDLVAETAVRRAGDLARHAGPAYRLAKSQLRRHTLEDIRRFRKDDDAEVLAMWAADETMGRIRSYLDALEAR